MSKAVFLDRDGVLNAVRMEDGRPYPPRTINELRILDGVSEALKKLHSAGFLLIVVTNQPDVARGSATKESVDDIINNVNQGAMTWSFLQSYKKNITWRQLLVNMREKLNKSKYSQIPQLSTANFFNIDSIVNFI